MSVAEHIKQSLIPPTNVVQGYLGDLSDADLLVRPCEGANHIAWQLGHLINAEHQLVEMVCPGSMPPLPEGFGDKYTTETAKLDDSAAFETKDRYLELMAEQRAGTLAALDKLSDADLAKPAPEKIQMLGATVGVIFAAQSMHWMMHAGQWAVVRRKLGKPPLF